MSIEMLGEIFARQLRAAAPMHADAERVASAGASLMARTLDGHTASVVPAELVQALNAHPWVGRGDGNTPLVHEQGLLYLRRFREAEVRVARALRERAIAGAEQFRLITGGPGTGKTTKVAELVARAMDANPEVRIALAAPTGKAAARMGEAIAVAWKRAQRLDLLERVQAQGQTLHRLLGYLPTADVFRRSADDPLEHDIVIIDEASMVPLLLMDALVQAVRPDALLILLGDHDQLASVEAGSVLADLVKAQGKLNGTVETLTKSYRFDAESGIGALAQAIRVGDADAAVRALGENAGVLRWLPAPDRSLLDGVSDVYAAEHAVAALEVLERRRVLCATNVGPTGTVTVNQRIEEALRRQGRSTSGQHYHGRPLLITRNDYALDLFNGDIGIVWHDEAIIATPGRGDGTRSVPLAQLPDALTAWAMTVHKSQGSEFHEVAIVLPDEATDILSRELLYTAVTRAKSAVTLFGSEAVLRAAIESTARRDSGLAARL